MAKSGSDLLLQSEQWGSNPPIQAWRFHEERDLDEWPCRSVRRCEQKNPRPCGEQRTGRRYREAL